MKGEIAETGDGLIDKVSDIYTSLSEAKEEVQRRWNDKELRKKVEDFWHGNMPEVFRKKPIAAAFRFIATPNLEFQLAYELSKIMGLDLVFMELLNDKFCTRNHDKVYLGKMFFFNQKSDKNTQVTCKKKIIDMEECDNKPFGEMRTTWGEDFIGFHKRIFKKKYGEIDTFDVSQFKTNGESSYEIYLKVFSLFVCNGIFFENYLINSDKGERAFALDVAMPAFNKIYEIFGVKPLVVPLLSYNEEEICNSWQYYPDSLVEEIKQ